MDGCSVLLSMGFSKALSMRALKLSNGNVEAAADMLLTNPPPVDEDDPEVERRQALVALGFSASAAEKALKAANGDVDMAALKLLSSPGEASDLDPLLVAPSPHRTRSFMSNATVDLTESSAALGSADSVSSASSSAQVSREGKSKRPSSNNRVESSSSLPGEGSSFVESGAYNDKEETKLGIYVRNEKKVDSTVMSDSQDRATKRSSSGSSSANVSEGKSSHAATADQDNVSCNDLDAMCAQLRFGQAAFGTLQRETSEVCTAACMYKAKQLKHILEASVTDIRSMRGERGAKTVTQMLCDCYDHGLFMHGPPTSPVNSQVVPALRYIFAEVAKLPPSDPKRVNCLSTLAHASQDCQQVQAREILRVYADLTSQNETFEFQLRYSLVRQKEAALNRYISKHHAQCDCDHTRVEPFQQRAHLWSGYVALVGDHFGLDGLAAARSDRFLPQVKHEIRKNNWRVVVEELQRDLSVKEWLQTLLADINNQNETTDRLIGRDCIFAWVQKNMSTEAAHCIFYDEDRAADFKGQDPEKPKDCNQYQPFLSQKVLIEMLVAAGMLTTVHESSNDGARISNKKRRRC